MEKHLFMKGSKMEMKGKIKIDKLFCDFKHIPYLSPILREIIIKGRTSKDIFKSDMCCEIRELVQQGGHLTRMWLNQVKYPAVE